MHDQQKLAQLDAAALQLLQETERQLQAQSGQTIALVAYQAG